MVIANGNGDGTFAPPAPFPPANDVLRRLIGASPFSSIRIGDLNNDGSLDLLLDADSSFGSIINIYLGNGDTSFQPPLTYIGAQASNSSRNAQLLDANGDGRLDLLVGSSLLLQRTPS